MGKYGDENPFQYTTRDRRSYSSEEEACFNFQCCLFERRDDIMFECLIEMTWTQRQNLSMPEIWGII
jgi:hypothetical protein